MEAHKIILDRILERHNAHGYKLPVLRPPLNSVAKGIQEFFNWLGNLFKFPFFEDLKLPAFNLNTLLAYVLLIGLGLMLVWAIYRALQNRNGRSTPAVSTVFGGAPGNEVEGLFEMISESLASSDFARAARWRWRLFLLRKTIPSCRTPLEAFPLSSENISYYSLMFREGKSTESLYEHFDRWIADKEKEKNVG